MDGWKDELMSEWMNEYKDGWINELNGTSGIRSNGERR